ncbi:hypothetical protein L3Q82_014630 [Scortum barcoo]|uniref:Uncharacterized protein n=1 Tax=Scortum barcoo TaxID=214431 RepID=A0ACB8VXH6_9TELE|nr:hypothetical protein L3Q82_014630 [Scortum barcoo]
MLHLKKYFTEGLIQMAILLSLCGVRVDVGLEPYLPPSWHEMILGPTSTLTQTQFHNLRNRLEDSQGVHQKNVDLDGFFTARRLLGWVNSLDRLQVPHAELETWLVQREPDPVPVGHPDQLSQPERSPAGLERDGTQLPVESRAVLGTLHDQEEEDREVWLIHSQCLHDDNRRVDLEHQPSGGESLLSPIENSSLDLELDWQDLLAIMEPENAGVEMISSDHTLNSQETGTFEGVRSEALKQNHNNYDNDVTEADQEVPLLETALQHGLLGPPSQSLLEPAQLPLTPSAEFDDHSSVLNTKDTLKNSYVNPLHSPPDHTDLLAEDPAEDFCLGLNAEDNLSIFNMNLLTQDLEDRGSPCPQYSLYPENLPNIDVNLHSHGLTFSSFTPTVQRNGMTQDLLTSPSSVSLVDEEEDIKDENGLPSPLIDLLEDSAILDEIRLLDLALEEGFSPEIAARLEEKGYLEREKGQQEDDDPSGPTMAVTENQGQPQIHQQDGENEADSDSGLSLDFSHSPASPSASEAPSYSSSSFSSSSVPTGGSTFSDDEDEDAEDWLVGPDMEMEVTIKQEELEEDEMGAVGGEYPEDVKKTFLSHYGDHKLFNGFTWLEHIGHDHTYNQPVSSLSLGKMPTKHTKSSLRHNNSKPYRRSSSRHIPETKMWSRDERRAQALKVPFSNELIINLPVEEFNDLLASYQLSEEQLTLVRDIRRRGKNKIAAQNCRKRKQDVLLGLKNNVSGLRRYRSRLLREKQEALRNLQEMKQQLGMLYKEVFSRLRDEEGRPLDALEYLLHFEADGSVTVASRQQGTAKPSKKQRDKRK